MLFRSLLRIFTARDAHATAVLVNGDFAGEREKFLPPAWAFKQGADLFGGELLFHGKIGVRHLTPTLSPVEAEREGQAVSVFVRHHDGDGGARVVHVHRAALGDELHELGGAVVVANV